MQISTIWEQKLEKQFVAKMQYWTEVLWLHYKNQRSNALTTAPPSSHMRVVVQQGYIYQEHWYSALHAPCFPGNEQVCVWKNNNLFMVSLDAFSVQKCVVYFCMEETYMTNFWEHAQWAGKAQISAYLRGAVTLKATLFTDHMWIYFYEIS